MTTISAMCFKRRRRQMMVERLEHRVAMCAAAVALQPAVELTAHEQQMLELINRARAAPAAEATRYGIALNDGLPSGTLGPEQRQPLAPSALLGSVAKAHTRDMLQRRFFSHFNPDGKGPVDRATAGGYYTTYVGENLSSQGLLALSAAPQTLHASLFKSPSHRVNTLLGGYREIGLGLEYGSIRFTSGQVQDGSIVTQLFGGGYPNHLYVTGVAFEDTVRNNLYDIGEGRGGVIVEARNGQGQRFATATGASGGYSLRLEPATYRLFAFPANRARVIDLGTVNLTTLNVKKDIAFAALASGLVMSESIVLSGSGQTLEMSDPSMNLLDLCRIDIRGSGDNVLRVDVNRLRAFSGNHVLQVHANSGDGIELDAGWVLESLRLDNGSLVRRLRNATSRIDLIGPNDFTNPIDPFDVNASGNLSSADALVIVNEISARRYSYDPNGLFRPLSTIDLEEIKFFDVNADGRVTSLDALRVINEMTRRTNLGISIGEQAFPGQLFATAPGSMSMTSDSSLPTESPDLRSQGRSAVGRLEVSRLEVSRLEVESAEAELWLVPFDRFESVDEAFRGWTPWVEGEEILLNEGVSFRGDWHRPIA